MALLVEFQFLLVFITMILSLMTCYLFFKMNWNYFLYFELIFLLLFIGYELIEFYYISLVVILLAILIYRALAPEISRRRGE